VKSVQGAQAQELVLLCNKITRKGSQKLLLHSSACKTMLSTKSGVYLCHILPTKTRGDL